MKQFSLELLGGIEGPIWLAWMLFGLIGCFTAILIRAIAKYKESGETPDKWNWLFLFRDNLLNIVIAILMVFIYVRFSQELIGKEPSAFIALMVGAGSNELALQFVKWSFGARKL